MKTLDPVIDRQFPLISKIVADETWLEGERRGRPVDARDPVVQEKVCEIILRMGAGMREYVMRELAAERQARLGRVDQPARAEAA